MSQPIIKTVNVRLLSVIRHPNVDEETIDIQTQGVLTLKGEQPYLVYNEIQDEKVIRTTVKLSSESALIMRSGDVKMRLPFLYGEFQTGSYDSGYGTIIITTNTKSLQFEDGHFKVEYELWINEEIAGTYKLELIYSEAN